MINIFNKQFEEIGSLDRNLVLKTLGEIKIQRGKSFFNLDFENKNEIIKSINSTSQIGTNGFYYVDGKLIAVVDNKQIILS